MAKMVDKKDIYKEVIIVLSNFNKEVIQKIPDSVFSKLIDLAADSTHTVNIDINKELEEQNLFEESKEMISLIYYKYIAEDDEKKELVKIWKDNDNK